MIQAIDYDELDVVLKQSGSDWNCAQTHGLLCGRLAVLGTDGAIEWLQQILGKPTADNKHDAECVEMLEAVFQSTWKQLAERQSELTLMLPDDYEDMSVKAEALGFWCEGFLHGVVSSKHDETLKARLATDPLAGLIKDMLEITRAGLNAEDDEESNESAYSELVEYVRVATQVAYEELADVRSAGGKNVLREAVSDALH